MPLHSARDFLKRLKDSALIAESQLTGLKTVDGDGNAGVVAEHFVKHGLLTPFQAERLIADDVDSLLIGSRYEIRGRIGAGGMGEVYLARDRQLDRQVAIKVLSPNLVRDADAVARFEREAKAMARLEHPAIVRAYDSGSDGERHFLVMEYVDGASLLAILKDAGALPAPTAADYAYQVALGLQHAHGKGLIHRDLKPSNLLIGQDGRIKILDLGLARFLQDQIDDETITVAGVGLGTPDYMAPEQFGNARHADERSDVYALGCTLYHMLTGRVPYPGSSLSQKQHDHQQKLPDRLEQSAPKVPAGLAQAVYKMMAKKPAERFQTARDCAEALMPYVAASSASLPDLSGTVEWEGSMLTIITGPQRTRRRTKWIAIAALIAVLGTGLGFGLAQIGKTDAGDPDNLPGALVAADSPRSSAKTGAAKSSPETKPSAAGQKQAKKKASPTAAEPWVLTVAQNGTGRFRTIGEALKAVEPGMTIRVLDGATYRERISLRNPARHAGVTLEAVAGAKIVNETAGVSTIEIAGVPDVTIRGFHLYATVGKGAHFALQNDCHGVVIQDVRLSAERGKGWNGAEILACNSATDNQAPLVIQRCEFDGLKAGIVAIGGVAGFAQSRRLVIRDSVFRDMEATGIQLGGVVRDALIAGNRFERCSFFAVHLNHPSTGAERVLIANNTFHQNSMAVRIDDKQVARGTTRFHNNLCLSPAGLDFLFFHSNNLIETGSKPGDVKALTKQWNFTNNVREIKRPTTDDANAKAWVPPSPADVVADKLEVLSRDASSPDYLRPKPGSPLANQGAGQTDPALPSYVGAVPPKGTPAWDWDRTWRAPPGKNKVLTVSKDAKDGGKYRTINAALKDVKPWDAIRVLDAATYVESLQVRNPRLHTGLVIESVKFATITPPDGKNPVAIQIQNVPHVAVRGFRLVPSRSRSYQILVAFKSGGTRLENLEFVAQNTPEQHAGIDLEQLDLTPDDLPITVRNCTFRKAAMGIRISGVGNDNKTPIPAGRLLIHENSFLDCAFGVHTSGTLFQTQIVGNRFVDNTLSAIHVENLQAGSGELLIANNTTFDCTLAFRLWDTAVRGTELAYDGNLALSTTGPPDMVFIRGQPATVDATGPGNPHLFRAAWSTRCNWREVKSISGTSLYGQSWIPPGPRDRRQAMIAVLSRKVGDRDFLRPAADSPLASGGAGGDLPRYVGAVPPKGVKPWDWSVTWRSRMMRTRYHASKSASPPE